VINKKLFFKSSSVKLQEYIVYPSAHSGPFVFKNALSLSTLIYVGHDQWDMMGRTRMHEHARLPKQRTERLRLQHTQTEFDFSARDAIAPSLQSKEFFAAIFGFNMLACYNIFKNTTMIVCVLRQTREAHM